MGYMGRGNKEGVKWVWVRTESKYGQEPMDGVYGEGYQGGSEVGIGRSQGEE